MIQKACRDDFEPLGCFDQTDKQPKVNFTESGQIKGRKENTRVHHAIYCGCEELDIQCDAFKQFEILLRKTKMPWRNQQVVKSSISTAVTSVTTEGYTTNGVDDVTTVHYSDTTAYHQSSGMKTATLPATGLILVAYVILM